MTKRSPQLDELLELYGVQASYQDVHRRRQDASVDSLMAALCCLGAQVDCPTDVDEALERRRRDLAARGIEPVLVAWDGKALEARLTLPAGYTSGPVSCELETEAGPIRADYRLEKLPRVSPATAEAQGFVSRRLRLPTGLAWGYHRLLINTPARTFESLVISAPCRAFSTEAPRPKKAWGGFLPLYAIRSERNWGAGDFTDLSELSRWLGGLGGQVVGTLPLLASFLDEPCDPSPYSPVSRLFWNEFYIDVTRTAEFQACRAARELVDSREFAAELADLRGSDLVEYRRTAALKRRVLERLAAWFFENRGPRYHEFQQFIDGNLLVENYAQFRAAGEHQQTAWQDWPATLRDGLLREGDFERRAVQYHLYVQWIAAEQMQSLVRETTEAGCGLYLDLPLGVRRDGYDVWRHQGLYATDATAGAPPDAVYTKGQDWQFSPLDPDAIRLDGYRHLRDVLEHHLRHADRLRIDHIMGLHRLYWIPKGLAPHEGVYVRYRPEEWYAVLALESHRHRSTIVGEDLGTVPPEVNEAMRQHAIRRMFTVQYELESEADQVLPLPDRRSVASINTHDMPPLAAWWLGEDIADRRELGLMDEEGALRERRRREALKRELAILLHRRGWLDERPEPLSVARGLVRWLADGPAELLLVNLEDLWVETAPQNVPGTIDERPNWRRKARYRLEQFMQMPDVIDVLQEVQQLREKRKSRSRRRARN